jgi:hypothetical protein
MESLKEDEQNSGGTRWAAWLPAHHGAVEKRGWQAGKDRAAESGDARGAETAATRAVVVARWLVYSRCARSGRVSCGEDHRQGLKRANGAFCPVIGRCVFFHRKGAERRPTIGQVGSRRDNLERD